MLRPRGRTNLLQLQDEILGDNGLPIQTREYSYLREDGQRFIIQDRWAGHSFGAGGVGDQGPRFSVRAAEDPRNGSVSVTQDHCPWGI